MRRSHAERSSHSSMRGLDAASSTFGVAPLGGSFARRHASSKLAEGGRFERDRAIRGEARRDLEALLGARLEAQAPRRRRLRHRARRRREGEVRRALDAVEAFVPENDPRARDECVARRPALRALHSANLEDVGVVRGEAERRIELDRTQREIADDDAPVPAPLEEEAHEGDVERVALDRVRQVGVVGVGQLDDEHVVAAHRRAEQLQRARVERELELAQKACAVVVDALFAEPDGADSIPRCRRRRSCRLA